MKEFRGSAVFLVSLYAFLTFLTLGCLAIFMLGITGAQVGRGVWFIPLGMVILAWVWWLYLKLPFIICVHDDLTLEFKSFLRVVTLSPQDIWAIGGRSLIPGFFTIRHNNGKMLLTTQMTDLPELMALIKTENPQVQMSSCWFERGASKAGSHHRLGG